MAAKTQQRTVDSPESPPFWAVKFLVASEKGDDTEVKEAREQLRAMGWEIRRINRGVKP